MDITAMAVPVGRMSAGGAAVQITQGSSPFPCSSSPSALKWGCHTPNSGGCCMLRSCIGYGKGHSSKQTAGLRSRAAGVQAAASAGQQLSRSRAGPAFANRRTDLAHWPSSPFGAKVQNRTSPIPVLRSVRPCQASVNGRDASPTRSRADPAFSSLDFHLGSTSRQLMAKAWGGEGGSLASLGQPRGKGSPSGVEPPENVSQQLQLHSEFWQQHNLREPAGGEDRKEGGAPENEGEEGGHAPATPREERGGSGANGSLSDDGRRPLAAAAAELWKLQQEALERLVGNRQGGAEEGANVAEEGSKAAEEGSAGAGVNGALQAELPSDQLLANSPADPEVTLRRDSGLAARESAAGAESADGSGSVLESSSSEGASSTGALKGLEYEGETGTESAEGAAGVVASEGGREEGGEQVEVEGEKDVQNEVEGGGGIQEVGGEVGEQEELGSAGDTHEGGEEGSGEGGPSSGQQQGSEDQGEGEGGVPPQAVGAPLDTAGPSLPIGLVETKDLGKDTLIFQFGPSEDELVNQAADIRRRRETERAALGSSASASLLGDEENFLSEAEEVKPKQHLRQLLLDVGVASVPHPQKASRGGEDAHLAEGNWIGVADGISAWAEQGVNSGLFSQELLWHCVDVIRTSWELLGVCPHPKAVIEESHSRTDLRGSSTICLAVVEGETLKVANIGDSGFVLLRVGELVLQSQRMDHGLGEPYQIGCNFGDDPSTAMVYEAPVQAGDILLLASDGLFDNVYTSEIVAELKAAAEEGKSPEFVAKKLAGLAHKYGESDKGDTPYAELAKAAGQTYEGGKREDVTVIVAYLSDPKESTAKEE